MRRIAQLLPCLSILALLVAPTGAHAAAMPVDPINGAVGTFPTTTFSWTLDPGHTSSQLRASKDRTLDDTGRLMNDAETVSVAETATTAALTGLEAGLWVWQVQSFDASFENGQWTTPAEFTVPFTLVFSTSEGYDRLTVGRRSGYAQIEIPIQANDNVSVRTLLTIKRGTSVVARSTSIDGVPGWFEVAPVYKRWYRPRAIRRGTRMTATATITGGGLRRTMSRTFLAP